MRASFGIQSLRWASERVLAHHPRHHVVDGDVGRDRRAAVGQRLHDERAVEAGEPRAALLGRHVDGGHAERRRLPDDVDGKVALLVPLARMRGDALLGEGERGLLDGGLFFRQREVHGRSKSGFRRRARAAPIARPEPRVRRLACVARMRSDAAIRCLHVHIKRVGRKPDRSGPVRRASGCGGPRVRPGRRSMPLITRPKGALTRE